MVAVNTAVVGVGIELQTPANAHQHIARPNRRVQSTPLRGRKIGCILKPGFGSLVFLVYRCAAADAQTVGWLNPDLAITRSMDRKET
jgi:hypothetical protein